MITSCFFAFLKMHSVSTTTVTAQFYVVPKFVVAFLSYPRGCSLIELVLNAGFEHYFLRSGKTNDRLRNSVRIYLLIVLFHTTSS